MHADYVDEASKMYNVSEGVAAELVKQCSLPEEVLEHGKGRKVFVASDHQNATLDAVFAAKGALAYSGRWHTKELGGLEGLAVDYFTLRAAHTFVGNTISSVSQNVCYARLARPFDTACAGWRCSLIASTLSETPSYMLHLQGQGVRTTGNGLVCE